MPNLIDLMPILESDFMRINGYEFYKYIFPNNENKGELNNEWKPNAIYLYSDEKKNENSKRQLSRRIMLKDTWESDYKEFIEGNPLALCGGLSYRGRANRLEQAQHMNALIFDLDSVNIDCINNVIHRFKNIGTENFRSIPIPTFIVLSGGGIHLYYVFEEPIELFPNIKVQLKQMKYDLTFRIWEYKSTSMEKAIQYQSINQGFRMVGSCNKRGNEVVAFKTGERVTLEYMNQYVDDEKKVDIQKRFRPTKMTKAEAKEKFPEWYQRVIVEGNKIKNKWNINKALYLWWKGKAKIIKGGHRYFYLMCLSIYAVKCNIPKAELKKDMYEVFGILQDQEHSNLLEERDILSALESYDKGLYNFTIDDIEKLTDVRIERNKRNGRNQKTHLKLARNQLSMLRELGEIKEGRPNKEELVKEYIKNNPTDSPTQIARALKISRPTVYKYLK